MFGLSVKEFADRPSLGRGLSALADAVGLLPVVPALSTVRRGGELLASGARLAKLRREFNSVVKPRYWKSEAASNASKYSPENLERMRQGKAPIGEDGYPMELHHKTPLSKDGTNDPENLQPMTQTEHRRGDNYRKNHPDREEEE